MKFKHIIAEHQSEHYGVRTPYDDDDVDWGFTDTCVHMIG